MASSNRNDELIIKGITASIDLPAKSSADILPADHNASCSTQTTEFPARHEITIQWRETVSCYQTVFANGTAAAAFLGASLLATATSDLGTHQAVRPVAAAGATLFILLFIICLGCTLLFAFEGADIARLANAGTFWARVVEAALAVLSITLQGLPIAGACCLFWVLKAYATGARYAGFVISVVLGSVAFTIWTLRTGRWVNGLRSGDKN